MSMHTVLMLKNYTSFVAGQVREMPTMQAERLVTNGFAEYVTAAADLPAPEAKRGPGRPRKIKLDDKAVRA